MELTEIVKRFAEGLVVVDASTRSQRYSQRTGEAYLQGVPTLGERGFVGELAAWWSRAHPEDFEPGGSPRTEVPYPDIARAKCDLVLDTPSADLLSAPEWAIEVKYVALVGNNGKNNDFGVAKVLSPYLKDRSLVHDIDRLRHHPMGMRQAVLGYGFDYDFSSLELAVAEHVAGTQEIGNIREVCRRNDPGAGNLTLDPLVRFANEIFTANGFVVDEVVEAAFSGAWRHPCGGNGRVFAWEVAPP